MVLVVLEYCAPWMERNRGLMSSRPIIAVLRLRVFFKVLTARSVASQGVGENAAWRLQVVVVRREATRLVPDGQASSRLSTSLWGAVDVLPKHTGVWGELHGHQWPPNLGCGLISALAPLAASDHASLVGMPSLVLQL